MVRSSVPFALSELRRHRLVAVIRAPSPRLALAAANAVADGGVRMIEVTFTVPEAPSVIRELTGRSDIVVGAGTVLTRLQARMAIDAGARFVIAPNLSSDVASTTLDAGVMFCPGALTTNEIIAARDAGAHVVKLYPIGVVGGPAYIQVIRDPLPDVPLLAAGGTNLDNTPAFLKAGCLGVGLGAALADPRLAAAGDFAEITRRARAFAELVGSAEPAPAARSSP